VADKKHIKKSLKQLQRIKTWQLFVLLLLMVFVSATLLRLNNFGMVQRREAVMVADKEGNDETIQARLYDLQRYVSEHMNTDMGKGVFLIETRKRDAQAIYEAAAADSNPNGNIYKKAQEVCAPKFSGYSYDYLQCTLNELNKYSQGPSLISEVDLPPASSYMHVFYSPLWSPDFAGWSVVINVVILIMIIVRLTSVTILKLILKLRFRGL
jgi:hypothetical protein